MLIFSCVTQQAGDKTRLEGSNLGFPLLLCPLQLPALKTEGAPDLQAIALSEPPAPQAPGAVLGGSGLSREEVQGWYTDAGLVPAPALLPAILEPPRCLHVPGLGLNPARDWLHHGSPATVLHMLVGWGGSHWAALQCAFPTAVAFCSHPARHSQSCWASPSLAAPSPP